MAKRKTASESGEPVPDSSAGNYTVLARRYRPQHFGDLIGQEHVAKALQNALESDRVAHAYLFTGARGVGKTSTARILAKALNCEQGPTISPCGECNACTNIAAGVDVDVLEIDGASNRGIDEVREIRQNVQYRPSRARFKIYIIDEVHMLTMQAFNALLKTLEEPPEHVKFIFATTEAQKIPITILSRCQRFDFSGIRVRDIMAQLQRIVAGEKREADDEALELVSRRAGGSMRDAESLLDQLLAFSEEKLTADHVHGLMGTAHDERISDLAGAVLAEDGARALALLDDAAEQGLDLSEILDQLIQYWRDLMVVHCSGAEGQPLSVGGAHRESLQQRAKSTAMDTLLAGLDILVGAKAKIWRAGAHVRVIAEMALVRLSRLGNLIALSQLAEMLKNSSAAPSSPAGTRPKPTGPSPQSTGATTAAKTGSKKNGAANEPLTKLEFTEENAQRIWEESLAHLSSFAKSQLLHQTRSAISRPNTLVIQFSAQYNSIREQFQQDADGIHRIEAALQKIVGRPIQTRIETASDERPTSPTGDAEGPRNSLRPSSAPSQAINVALVQKVMETFDAQLMKEDPGFGEETPDSDPDATEE